MAPKFVAYDNNAKEYKPCDTFDDARNWIIEQCRLAGVDPPDDFAKGECFIAKVTHRTTIGSHGWMVFDEVTDTPTGKDAKPTERQQTPHRLSTGEW